MQWREAWFLAWRFSHLPPFSLPAKSTGKPAPNTSAQAWWQWQQCPDPWMGSRVRCRICDSARDRRSKEEWRRRDAQVLVLRSFICACSPHPARCSLGELAVKGREATELKDGEKGLVGDLLAPVPRRRQAPINTRPCVVEIIRACRHPTCQCLITHSHIYNRPHPHPHPYLVPLPLLLSLFLFSSCSLPSSLPSSSLPHAPEPSKAERKKSSRMSLMSRSAAPRTSGCHSKTSKHILTC